MIYSTRASTETLEDTIRFLSFEQEDRGIKKETCSLKICPNIYLMCFFIVKRQSVANSSQLCYCWSTRSLLAATSLIRRLMSVLCLLRPRFVIFWRDGKLSAGLSINYICLQVDNFAFGLLIVQHLPADNRARGTLLKVCFWKVVAVAPLSYCRLSSARLAAVSRPVLSSALCIRALFRNEPLCMGIM